MSTNTVDLNGRIFQFETAVRADEARQWIAQNLGDTSRFLDVFGDADRVTSSHLGGTAS